MASLHRFILPLFIAVPALAAPVDEARNVPEFNGVHVGSGIRARVEAGTRSVTLRGEPEALRVVLTEVKDGKLSVRIDPKVDARPNSEIRVLVKLPQAGDLSVSGGSDMEASVPTGDPLALAASGGGHLRLAAPVRAGQLAVAGSGGSKIVLSGGRAASVSLSLSGGSELDAPALATDSLAVQESGGSIAAIRAGGTVAGALSGGSRVRVPASAKVSVASSGGSEVVTDL